MKSTVNKAIARKVVALVGYGLVRGVGIQEPGKMCVEAAVCCALGLPHGDNPPCVSRAVRSFKIALNDSEWSSNKARAKGLRRLAVAQLGSDSIDDVLFVKELALSTIRRVLPIALRNAKLEKEAAECESCKDLESAESAARSAAAAAAAAAKDKVLYLAAECAVGALIKCKSPGCQWLDLCN